MDPEVWALFILATEKVHFDPGLYKFAHFGPHHPAWQKMCPNTWQICESMLDKGTKTNNPYSGLGHHFSPT